MTSTKEQHLEIKKQRRIRAVFNKINETAILNKIESELFLKRKDEKLKRQLAGDKMPTPILSLRDKNKVYREFSDTYKSLCRGIESGKITKEKAKDIFKRLLLEARDEKSVTPTMEKKILTEAKVFS